ncbi:MAG: hypothetical protein QM783_19005 [Phycisphaerales bacterium]
MGDWVWYLGAGVLGVGGAWLFLWAWWGDRARGRARCGRCWYSLGALMNGGGALPVCPECGWRGKRRGSYFKSRRRRVLAALAVTAILSAAVLAATPRVRREGWGLAPDWLVLGYARAGFTPSGGYSDELVARCLASDRLSAWAPIIYRSNKRVRLSRDVWVKGYPLRVTYQSTYASGTNGRLSFGPVSPGTADSASPTTNQSHENWWSPLWAVQPRESASGDAYLLEVRPYSFGAGRTFQFEVPLKNSLDEVMKPVALERQGVLGALKPSVFVLPTTRNLALSVSDVTDAEIGAGAAFGMKVEVVRKGEVIARGRWYQSATTARMAGRPVLVRFGLDYLKGSQNGPMTCTLDELLADECVVRFSTDEEMALSALECDKYWRGSFEVPLKELVK